MRLPHIKIKSFTFISSLVLFLIVSVSTILIPNSTWKKIFSGRFNLFAATYSATPNPEVYITNNDVNAVAPDGSGGVYIGGAFTTFGLNVGRGVPLTTSDGLPVAVYPKVNNEVDAVIEDGSGGWYIGGSFTQVGTESTGNVAHILSNGTVDTSFDPNFDGGDVLAFALSPDKTILYVGGTISSVNQLSNNRNNIAAVYTSNGLLVDGFDPEADGYVDTLALTADGNTLYFGGNFTTLGTSSPVTRNHLAAVNTSDGQATSFDPSIGGAVYSMAFTDDESILYIGGDFTSIGTSSPATRNYIASINVPSGVVTAFNPDSNGQIYSMTLSPDEGTVYFGGIFDQIGVDTREFIAAVSTTTGAVTSFNASTDDLVFAIALSSDGNTLYLGGQFTQVNSENHSRIAAVDISTGSSSLVFSPNVNSTVNSLALSPDDSILYIGGGFSTLAGSTAHNRVAHILSDGSIDPDFDPSIVGGAVKSMAYATSTNILYIAGAFTTVNSVSRTRIAAVNGTDGTLVDSFDPGADFTVYSSILSQDESVLFVGGSFLNIGTTTPIARNRIAAINTSDGLPTSFDPNADSEIYSIALAPDGDTVFLGGGFSSLDGGGTSRNYIAQVSTSTGSSTDFNPGADGPVLTVTPSQDGSILYVGGTFTNIGTSTPIARNHLAAINVSDSNLVMSFDPDVSSDVYTLFLSDNTLYLGGSFTTVSSIARNRLAAVSVSGVLDSSFNPNANSTVFALAPSSDGNTLFAGGAFATIGGVSFPRFVSFPIVTTTPSTPRRNRVIVVSTPEAPELIVSTTSTTTLTVLPKSILALIPAASTTSSTTPTTVSTTTPNVPESFCFIKNLSSGTTDSDVRYLQVFLNDQGLNVTVKGSETNYYGTKTVNGVVAFQRMIPGVLPGTGYFGNYTRKKANDILGCETIFEEAPTSTPPVIEAPTSTPPVIEAPTSTPPTEVPPEENVPTPPAPVITEGLLSNLIDGIRQSYDQTLLLLGQTLPQINDIINSPTGSLVTKIITIGALVLALFASLGAIAFATPATFSEIWLIPGRLIGLFLGALGIKRKIRRWGTVYDSVTKRPLDPVYVTLIDVVTNKEVASAITDLDGRYGFLVAPGKYKIVAKKTNYVFPSQKMAGIPFDEVYNDLYYGSEIDAVSGGEAITKNIPMDPTTFDWNEFTKNKSNINTFLKKKDVTWARLSKTMFIIGAVVSLLALIFAPKPYNLIIALLYVFAYVLNYFVFKVKKPGTIKEKATNLPLSYAIVKIFREGMPADMPIVKKITDKYGRYYSLVPKGNYSIQVDKKNNDGSYVEVFRSNMANIQNGIINEDLVV